MKKFGVVVLLFTTSSFAIDQSNCESLAAKQKDNVIPDYQPLNQGNAGLCTSFAMSLSVSSALGKSGGKPISPLSIAKSIEGWRTNGGNKQALNEHVNFYGDTATKEERLSVIDDTLNKKMQDTSMSTLKQGVTSDANSSSATFGAKSYSNKDMEGVSISELASTLAAEGKACSSKGSKFAGSSFEDWTNTKRENYSGFTDFEESTRETGDASFLMGQISYLYDANKGLKRKGIQKENIKNVINQAKRVCDMQVTQVVKDKLKEEAAKMNPCKGTIPFGPENNYLVEVCNSGAFKPTMSVDEFVAKNKAMLVSGEQGGFKEMLKAMQKDFFATQVSQRYSDEVNGNLLSGKVSPEAYIPKWLSDKIEKENQIIKTAPEEDKTFIKKNALYRLEGLQKSAELMASKGRSFIDGETTAERFEKQISNQLKAQNTGITLKTESRPISGNPRQYQQDFLTVAKSDPAFAANESVISTLEDKLVRAEGQGNTVAYEERMVRSLPVETGTPSTQAIADQLKVRIEQRRTLTRKLNKQNMPPELLNSQGDLAVSFKSLDSYLAKAAGGKNGSEYKSLRSSVHNADLSQKLSKDIKAIEDNWGRIDRTISKEEFQAKVQQIRTTIAAAKLDPSYASMDKDKLSGVDLASLDKLAALDPKSKEAGSIIYNLRKANDLSTKPDPYDFLAQTDLNGDGKLETGNEDNISKLEPIKSSKYAKALINQQTLGHEYALTKAAIINNRNDDKDVKQNIDIERADLRYENLNDCLSQNIASLVRNAKDPNSKPICETGDNDLVYSLTSLASFFDDTDKVINALDDSPTEFWNQVVECDPSEVVDLSGLNFDVYMLDKKNLTDLEKEALMLKALGDSVAKDVPMTIGMCLNALQGLPCDPKSGDNHAMAIVGYSAKWNAATKSCDVNYKVANSWGKKCDPRVDSSKAGVTCDSSNGIITVPQKVFNSGAKQLSVVKKK